MRKYKGYTLWELTVSMIIIGLIISVSAKPLQSFSEKNGSRAAVQKFKRILTLARNTALTRRIRITACPIQNSECNNNWRLPNIAIFEDANNNLKIDGDETIISSASVANKLGYWKTRAGTGNAIVFDAFGHAFNSATTFIYCPSSNRYTIARQVIISFQGRIRSKPYLSQGGTPYKNLKTLLCD